MVHFWHFYVNTPHQLLTKINDAKEELLEDDTYLDLCKEYEVSPEVIHLIPIRFGDIDTSAKTIHGVIVLNRKLLDKGEFQDHIHYILHEIIHFLQMVTRKKPTKKKPDEEYLDNKDELEAFQYQIEFMGKGDGEDYVEKLLDHHEVDDEDEREEKMDELMDRFVSLSRLP